MRERADGGRLAATLAARHHTGEKGGEGEEGRGVAAADLREEWQAAGRGGAADVGGGRAARRDEWGGGAVGFGRVGGNLYEESANLGRPISRSTGHSQERLVCRVPIKKHTANISTSMKFL